VRKSVGLSVLLLAALVFAVKLGTQSAAPVTLGQSWPAARSADGQCAFARSRAD